MRWPRFWRKNLSSECSLYWQTHLSSLPSVLSSLLSFISFPITSHIRKFSHSCNWAYTTRLSYLKRLLGRDTPQHNVPICITEFSSHLTVQRWSSWQQTYCDNSDGQGHDFLSEHVHIKDNAISFSLGDKSPPWVRFWQI